MATPSASTMLSDVAQWTKAMDMGNRILNLNKSLSNQVETVVSVAKKAEDIDPKSDIERELQQSMKELCKPGEDMLAVSRTLSMQENELTEFLKQAVEGKSTDSPTDKHQKQTTKANSSQSIEISTVENCIKKIETVLELAETFAKSIGNFKEKIEAVEKVCERLQQQLEEDKQKLEKEARLQKAGGVAGATVCSVGAVALGIAGFFTFGTTWAGAAFLGTAAAAAGGGAVAIGVMTHHNSKKFNEDVKELKEKIADLGAQLKELKSLPEKLATDETALRDIKESIEYVLTLYKEKQDQFERERKLQDENTMLKQKDSEQEEKIRQLEEKQAEEAAKLQEENRMLMEKIRQLELEKLEKN